MVYTVKFSYRNGFDHSVELEKVRSFFEELETNELIIEYRILRYSSKENPSYLALIDFENDNTLNRAMRMIATIGIRSGKHGTMIENTDEFSVGFHDDVTTQDRRLFPEEPTR